MTDLLLILTTVPADGCGEAIARALVDARLVACANLYPAMTSTYRWKGKIETEQEQQLVLKTTSALVDDVRARVAELHPYELPEWLVLPVGDASPGYAAWVRAETDGSDTSRTR